MLEQILEWDQSLFLFLNGLHHQSLDKFMILISGEWFWIPFYAFLLFLWFKKFGWRVLYLILAVALLLLITDQSTSAFMKPFFQRLRPCRDPALESLVYNIGGCAGVYGFASSHAANTFGFAFLMNFLLKKQWHFLWLLYPWAFLVSYSRIYLGVHYPLDILGGILLAWIAALLLKFLIEKSKIYSFIDTAA